MQMSGFTLAVFIAAVFLLAGGVKGVLGLGLPTVGMGLLSIVMTPAQAAGILVIPALVTNVWQVASGPTLLALLRRFALMIVATVIGTFSTVEFLTTSSGSTATGALGAVLAAYGIYGLVGAKLQIRPRWERWLSPLVGFVTGMLNGATGVFVIPAAPYLTSLRLDKEELVQTVGINAFICPLALAAALMVHGELRIEVAVDRHLREVGGCRNRLDADLAVRLGEEHISGDSDDVLPPLLRALRPSTVDALAGHYGQANARRMRAQSASACSWPGTSWMVNCV